MKAAVRICRSSFRSVVLHLRQISLNGSGDMAVYRTVFVIEACPRKCWSRRVSIPRFARAYPVECLSICTCTGNGRPAAFPARLIILLMPSRSKGVSAGAIIPH